MVSPVVPGSPRYPHTQIYKEEIENRRWQICVFPVELFGRCGLSYLVLLFVLCVYVYLYKEEIGKNVVGQAEV